MCDMKRGVCAGHTCIKVWHSIVPMALYRPHDHIHSTANHKCNILHVSNIKC